MMKQIQEQTALSPLHSHWRLADDRNVLYLSPTGETDAEKTVELSPEQAGRIREITAITSSLLITLLIEKQVIAVHLVGRKINNREWAGSLATWPDTPAVAPTQAQELSFAEQIVSEANSVIAILDSQGKICRFNQSCEEYTGLKERDVIGQSVFKLFMSRREAVASRHYIENFFRNGNAYEIERWIKTRKGQRLFLFRNKFVHNGSGKNEIFLICAGTDITEERRAQERLRILANTDTVTGLPNRNAIHEFINHAIASAGESQVGIVYLDLDNFKKINDAYGHMFGDQLLLAVSLALLSCLEEDQLLARLGGDEFIVLAAHTSQAALEAVASRILTRLRQPFRIGLIEVYTGCAIGISLAPRHGQDSESLIRTADTAMYNAKEGGRGQFCVFSPEMNQRVFDYHWLDTNLRKALENDQLLIHYQPKITWRGEVRSLEALVRWQSPERGLIPPLEFISYAEESGLIVPLGRWVILDVVRQIAKWRDKGINLRVAVNFSARQLADQTLFTALKQALYDLNFEYCPIDVELTESCLIENARWRYRLSSNLVSSALRSIWMILAPGILRFLNSPGSLLMPLNWIRLSSEISISNRCRNLWLGRLSRWLRR